MPGGAGMPGAPAAGAGMRPAASFEVPAGTGVKVSGTVVYAGSKTGQYRIDFLKPNKGSFPELLHSITLDKPGAWEIEAPKGTGEVAVVGFLDADGNGPSDGEPAALTDPPLTIGDKAITGVTLTLSDTPDLKDLKPPGGPKAPGIAAPAGGAGGPTPAGATPGGATPGGPVPGGEAPPAPGTN